jgi:hypothetical protein
MKYKIVTVAFVLFTTFVLSTEMNSENREKFNFGKNNSLCIPDSYLVDSDQLGLVYSQNESTLVLKISGEEIAELIPEYKEAVHDDAFEKYQSITLMLDKFIASNSSTILYDELWMLDGDFENAIVQPDELTNHYRVKKHSNDIMWHLVQSEPQTKGKKPDYLNNWYIGMCIIDGSEGYECKRHFNHKEFVIDYNISNHNILLMPLVDQFIGKKLDAWACKEN